MPLKRDRAVPRSDSLEDLRWREDVQTAAREWRVDVGQVKPCVARIRGIREGERDNDAYYLATELRRMGIPERRAHDILSRWNEDNRPPLSVSQLAGEIKSAFGRERVYGCNGPLSDWCIGESNCPYYARFVCGPSHIARRTTMVDFDNLGWGSPHVTPAQRLVYYGVTRLEAIRDCGAGGCVITSLRHLAQLEKLSVTCVRESLRALNGLGLISYRPGTPRATGVPVKGCTIRRVIPIPDPPTDNPQSARELRRRLRNKSATQGAEPERGSDPPDAEGTPMVISSTFTKGTPIGRGAHV